MGWQRGTPKPPRTQLTIKFSNIWFRVDQFTLGWGHVVGCLYVPVCFEQSHWSSSADWHTIVRGADPYYISDRYSSTSSTSAEPRWSPTRERCGFNSMTLNITFLPSPSRHPAFAFNESIAKSLTPFTRSLNSCFR